MYVRECMCVCKTQGSDLNDLVLFVVVVVVVFLFYVMFTRCKRFLLKSILFHSPFTLLFPQP